MSGERENELQEIDSSIYGIEHLLRNRPRRRPQQHRRIQLRQLQKPQQHQNLRKQLRRQAQGLSPAIQETHLQKRKKKLHI